MKKPLPKGIYRADEGFVVNSREFRNDLMAAGRMSPILHSTGVTSLKKVLNSEITLEDMIEYLHDKNLADRQYDTVIAVHAAIRQYQSELDYEFLVDDFWIEDVYKCKKACFNFWSSVKSIEVSLICYPEGLIVPRAIYVSDNLVLPLAGAEVCFSMDTEQIAQTLSAINKFLANVY